MPLNELEKAVLEALLRKTPNELHILERQLKEIDVSSRRNTGGGFYCKLEPNKIAEPSSAKFIGGVFADVEGLSHPMAFVLFIKEGFIDTLEGAATDENTANIDFSNVRFEIIE